MKFETHKGVEFVRIGPHKLIRGDCLNAMAVMGDGSIDMIWTDPPYGHNNADGDLMEARIEVLKDGDKKKKFGDKYIDRESHKPIANDGQDDMKRVVSGMLVEAVRVMRKESSVCCCCCGGGGGPRPTFAWLANRMDRKGLQFFHSVIWYKKAPGLGWRYRRCHEMVMVAHRADGKLAWAIDDVAVPNMLSHSAPLTRDRKHPNEKPMGLVSEMVQLHTTKGQVVLDPFMGSGTTGEVCVRTGRRFIGVELDPAYFEVAYNRILQAYDESQRGLASSLVKHRKPDKPSLGIQKKKKPKAVVN